MERDFSNCLHSFLKQIKMGKVNESQRKKLADVVVHLEKNTKKQTERFIKYYCFKEDIKQVTLEKMASEEGCTVNAIRCSLVSVIFRLARLNDYRRDILINIMKNID